MSRPIPIEDTASVAVVRQEIRALSARYGVHTEIAERAALVASELGNNQLRHARLGEIRLDLVERGAHRGLEIIAVDGGSGLADPIRAFRGELRSTSESLESGLGVGLAGVRRQASEIDVQSRSLEGVKIHARILPRDCPTEPSYALVGIPHPDEHISGDDAAIVRLDHRIVLILADGLGHGPEARQASEIACRCCIRHAALPPAEALRECDRSLRGSRGSAVAMVSLDLRTDQVSTSITGNVRVGLYGPQSSQRFPYTPSVLGRGLLRSPRVTTVPRQGRTLLLFTDGLSDRADPTLDRAGLSGWPLPLAWRLLERNANNRDDATVLALR